MTMMDTTRTIRARSSRPRSTLGDTIVRARSPLRVSFSGGGTDLPHWYREHPGAVLSTTINRHAYVTLYPRDDQKVRIRSLDLGCTVHFSVDEPPAYDGVLDLAKAVIGRLGAGLGMDLEIRSDAPPGSGLGGSSALTAALIGAISGYRGKSFNESELAELNFEVERIDLKIVGGKQDQYATTYGGLNLIEFHPDRVEVSRVDVSWDVLNDLESHLLLCYTGRARADLGIVERQAKSCREGRTSTIDGLFRLYELVFEMKSAIVDGRLNDFGELLHESYLMKKRISPDLVRGTIADRLYDEARGAGAIGGKLLGAGGGGYLLIYCETERQCEVRRALDRAGGRTLDFSFEPRGLQTWRSSSR
jgi:D-glycero-alpha-D-manno-heptose-7-phosphate kinase